jgi:hypothetical protein
MLAAVFEDVHAVCIDSTARYSTANMRAVRASVTAIGAAYDEIAALEPKPGVEQLDRLLSNKGLAVATLIPAWMRVVLGGRSELIFALDSREPDAKGAA